MNNFSSYDDKIVNKPWGHEYTSLRIKKKIAITFLHINRNKRTSLHCHPNKKTAFVVLNGKIKVQYGIYKKNSKVYNPLSRLVLREGLFHSLQAISKNGAKVLEFEKPANKNDLIRFSDDYGREKKNYEGKRFTKKINLNSVKLKVPKKKNKSLNFKYKNINLNLSFKRNFSKIQKNDKSTCAILDGKIIDEKNRTVIDYGEVIKTNTLKILAKKFFIKKPILVLHISKIKKN